MPKTALPPDHDIGFAVLHHDGTITLADGTHLQGNVQTGMRLNNGEFDIRHEGDVAEVWVWLDSGQSASFRYEDGAWFEDSPAQIAPPADGYRRRRQRYSHRGEDKTYRRTKASYASGRDFASDSNTNFGGDSAERESTHCPKCGDSRVRKVSVVLDEQKDSPPRKQKNGRPTLAEKLAPPNPHQQSRGGVGRNSGRAIRAVILGVVVAVLVWRIVGAFAQDWTIAGVLAVVAGGCAGGLLILLESLRFSRKYQRRQLAIGYEWYCPACDCIYQPGKPETIRSSADANRV